jgi:hypothetical protein
MKKSKIHDEQEIRKETDEEIIPGEATIDEVVDVNSIQEFIELKKLQNRILGKMIEKLNQPENNNKPKTK